MTTAEQRAAERFRAKRYKYDDADSGSDSLDRMFDAEALAEAYLAEHPADDGEAVTAEWLESVGFSDYGLLRDFQGGMWLGHVRCHELRTWRVGAIELPHIRTRGDVRRRAAAARGARGGGEGMTDEQFGRAWAAQQEKEPLYYDGSGWKWERGVEDQFEVPPAVYAHLSEGAEVLPGIRYYHSEAAAYDDLGYAVRAVHAAVPPLKDVT